MDIFEPFCPYLKIHISVKLERTELEFGDRHNEISLGIIFAFIINLLKV